MLTLCIWYIFENSRWILALGLCYCLFTFIQDSIAKMIKTPWLQFWYQFNTLMSSLILFTHHSSPVIFSLPTIWLKKKKKKKVILCFSSKVQFGSFYTFYFCDDTFCLSLYFKTGHSYLLDYGYISCFKVLSLWKFQHLYVLELVWADYLFLWHTFPDSLYIG